MQKSTFSVIVQYNFKISVSQHCKNKKKNNANNSCIHECYKTVNDSKSNRNKNHTHIRPPQANTHKYKCKHNQVVPLKREQQQQDMTLNEKRRSQKKMQESGKKRKMIANLLLFGFVSMMIV